MSRPVLTPLDGIAIIGTAELEDQVVTTAKIADVNVTTGKLADSAVTTAKIANGTIVLDVDVNTTSPGWAFLPLTAGWAAAPGFEAPTYTRLGSIVIVSGTVRRVGAGATIGNLPVGFRPVADIVQPATWFDASGGTTSAQQIAFDADGEVRCTIGSGGQLAVLGIFRSA